jgi:hypothetical protein
VHVAGVDLPDGPDDTGHVGGEDAGAEPVGRAVGLRDRVLEVLGRADLMICAVCSARSSASSAARSRIRIRSWAGVRRQLTAPASARSSAARTSSGPATGTVPVIVPSNGEVTSSVRPLAVACHVPPISIFISAYSPVSGLGSMHSTLHDLIHQVNSLSSVKNSSFRWTFHWAGGHGQSSCA